MLQQGFFFRLQTLKASTQSPVSSVSWRQFSRDAFAVWPLVSVSKISSCGFTGSTGTFEWISMGITELKE